MYRGLDTLSVGHRRMWQGSQLDGFFFLFFFFEDFLECLRGKYPFLFLLLVKGRRGQLSCPQDWMGETFPVESETSVGER